jgi:hypothetical protein
MGEEEKQELYARKRVRGTRKLHQQALNRGQNMAALAHERGDLPIPRSAPE